jgi:hypothetical protein
MGKSNIQTFRERIMKKRIQGIEEDVINAMTYDKYRSHIDHTILVMPPVETRVFSDTTETDYWESYPILVWCETCGMALHAIEDPNPTLVEKPHDKHNAPVARKGRPRKSLPAVPSDGASGRPLVG